jgi:hypothetical protein
MGLTMEVYSQANTIGDNYQGEMSIEDDARSGRPKDAVTDENIKKVHKIILNDRKVKLIEIAKTLKI